MAHWREEKPAGSLREFGEKMCFGSPTKHFVIFDLADMFRLDVHVNETPILRQIYVKYTSRKHQFCFFLVKNLLEGDAVIEMVPVLRLSEWIKHHVTERRIPSLPFGVNLNQTQLL